jgi:CRP/FNR family transcriptional regulator, cyclic AMP receptor protein
VSRTPIDSSADAQAPAVVRALAISHLGSLPQATLVEMTHDATLLRVAAGSAIHRDGDTAAHLEVVVSGLIRVFLSAPDGRTLTVRYCRPGQLMGALSLFTDSFSMPATTQALIDSAVLALQPATVRRLAERDTQVAVALMHELSERATAFVAEISQGAFSTVRQRLCRHLLDLASDAQSGRELFVGATQQELAEAVGSVREVVVRTLRELRAEGIVQTDRRGIRVLEPGKLLLESGT